jgi:hypothetical protein
LPDLKPGVSARAEIVITNIANTLKVPIQSVTTVNSQQVVYKSSIGDPERTPVQVGLFNTKFIQILKGVGEDDRILLAPPLKMEEVDLAGEIFDDGEKMSDSDLKPDTKALEKLKPKAGERGGRPQMQGGPAGQRGQGKQGGQGGGSFNREAMMKRFDTNGDGKVSDEERAAAIKQFQKSQGGGGAPGGK